MQPRLPFTPPYPAAATPACRYHYRHCHHTTAHHLGWTRVALSVAGFWTVVSPAWTSQPACIPATPSLPHTAAQRWAAVVPALALRCRLANFTTSSLRYCVWTAGRWTGSQPRQCNAVLRTVTFICPTNLLSPLLAHVTMAVAIFSGHRLRWRVRKTVGDT